MTILVEILKCNRQKTQHIHYYINPKTLKVQVLYVKVSGLVHYVRQFEGHLLQSIYDKPIRLFTYIIKFTFVTLFSLIEK